MWLVKNSTKKQIYSHELNFLAALAYHRNERNEKRMNNKIPNSVIGVVSPVIATYYYSHSTLNSLFMASGAPGEAPERNCETKCPRWFQRCNADPDADLGQPLPVLRSVSFGHVAQCEQPLTPGEYAAIARVWQAGDVVTLPMPPSKRPWQESNAFLPRPLCV